MLMGGPPGSGKTLLARGVPSILPPMSFDEALTVTKIYSVAGQLPGDTPLIRHRPYRAPPEHRVRDPGPPGSARYGGHERADGT